MNSEKLVNTLTARHHIKSTYLKRTVIIDCYIPLQLNNSAALPLLLINDGQDLAKMPFDDLLDAEIQAGNIEPIFCVGIHCSADRKNEYGTAKVLDYKGRGTTALSYNFFVMQELLPFLRSHYSIYTFKDKSFAGFSLGGLSALDMVWNHAEEFSKVGIFSGSLWWRDVDQYDKTFDENINRIMHRQIEQDAYKPWLKFFFEVGTQDETNDRNGNGIIDSIDDTQGLIKILHAKGYSHESVEYLELQNGRHDVPTWASAFPAFLKWGWGR